MNKNCIILTTNSELDGLEQFLNIENRIFDIIVIDYLAEEGKSKAHTKDVNLVYESNGGFKFNNIKKLILSQNLLQKYDYFWFPDWDLEIDGSDFTDLFYLAKKHNFLLSQPSLSWDSFLSWKITMHNPTSEVRATGFVEIMCPLFERSFLEKVLYTFDMNYSGWGLDLLWSKLLDYEKIGIIDKVIIKHRKPVSSHTWKLPNNKTANQELDHILENMDTIVKNYFS
jgi:hypothetical protein